MVAPLVGDAAVGPVPRKLKGDHLRSYEAADLTKITIVATKRW
jgi:hypothetical protein